VRSRPAVPLNRGLRLLPEPTQVFEPDLQSHALTILPAHSRIVTWSGRAEWMPDCRFLNALNTRARALAGGRCPVPMVPFATGPFGSIGFRENEVMMKPIERSSAAVTSLPPPAR
jgi:hypothetical protein